MQIPQLLRECHLKSKWSIFQRIWLMFLHTCNWIKITIQKQYLYCTIPLMPNILMLMMHNWCHGKRSVYHSPSCLFHFNPMQNLRYVIHTTLKAWRCCYCLREFKSNVIWSIWTTLFPRWVLMFIFFFSKI